MFDSKYPVEDLILIILTNLEQLSVESISSIIDAMGPNSTSGWKPVFEESLEFYKDNNKFPGPDYLEAKYDPLFTRSLHPYTNDILIDCLSKIRHGRFIKEIEEATSFDDVEKIKKLTEEYSKVSFVAKKEFEVSDVVDAYKRRKNRPKGLMMGIPELDDLTKGFMYGSFNVLGAPTSNFKCVAGNTKVHSSLGYKKIEDMYFKGLDEDSFHELEVEVRDNYKTSHFYYGGLKPTIKIKSDVFELEGTEVHPVMVYENDKHEWRQLKDIRVGDLICLDAKKNILFNQGTPKINQFRNSYLKTDLVSEFEYGYFIGLILAHGRRSGNCISVPDLPNKGDAELIRKGFEKTPVRFLGTKLMPSKNILRLIDTGITQALSAIGIEYLDKKEAVLPDWVFESNEFFIRGLLSSFLYLTQVVTSKDGNTMSSISIPSVQLGYQIRDLINLLGFYPSLKTVKDKNGFLSCDITFNNGNDLDLITLINISDQLSKVEYTYTPVMEIEQSESFVYDLSVPETHTFMANGVISHNTTTAISTLYRSIFTESKNAVYITLEVSPEDVFFNLMSRHSYSIRRKLQQKYGMEVQIEAVDLKKALLDDLQEKCLVEDIIQDWEENVKGKIAVVTPANFPQFTPLGIQAYLEAKQKEWGRLDVVFLDHMGLMKNYRLPYCKDGRELIGYYTNFFRELAVRFNDEKGLIFIALTQVNRESTDKLNTKADNGKRKSANPTFFADCSEIENAASIALILHATPAMKLGHNVDIYLVKNRDYVPGDEPINTIVLPEFFLVGSEDYGDIFSLDSIRNPTNTNIDEINIDFDGV